MSPSSSSSSSRKKGCFWVVLACCFAWGALATRGGCPCFCFTFFSAIQKGGVRFSHPSDDRLQQSPPLPVVLLLLPGGLSPYIAVFSVFGLTSPATSLFSLPFFHINLKSILFSAPPVAGQKKKKKNWHPAERLLFLLFFYLFFSTFIYFIILLLLSWLFLIPEAILHLSTIPHPHLPSSHPPHPEGTTLNYFGILEKEKGYERNKLPSIFESLSKKVIFITFIFPPASGSLGSNGRRFGGDILFSNYHNF